MEQQLEVRRSKGVRACVRVAAVCARKDRVDRISFIFINISRRDLELFRITPLIPLSIPVDFGRGARPLQVASISNGLARETAVFFTNYSDRIFAEMNVSRLRRANKANERERVSPHDFAENHTEAETNLSAREACASESRPRRFAESFQRDLV